MSELFNIQNYRFSPHAIAPFISSILVVFIGSLVYAKNRKSEVNISLGIFSLGCFIWQIGTFFMFLTSNDKLALFWDRFVYIGVVFLPAVLYHFSCAVTGIKSRRVFITGYVLSGIFLILSRTGYFLNGVFRYSWGVHGRAALLHHVFLIFFSYYMYKSIFGNLYSAFRRSTGVRKNQFKYIFLAIFILLLGSLAYLPAYKVSIYPFSYWFATIYVLILSYAIIRYKAMEIDTVVHRTILWIITSMVVFLPIFSIIYFIRDFIHSLNRFSLSLFLTVMFFIIVYYYKTVQPKIDHLFRRRKYDYYQVLSEIGQKIGSELDINNVIARLFKELKGVLYIRNGLMLVRQLGQEDYTEAGSIGYDRLQDAGRNTGWGGIYNSSKLIQWLSEHKKTLEREQIEIDPQYESIKEEALHWLNQNMIEVLIPVVMQDRVNGLIGIGKKENLQAYTAKDIELLERMGRQIGVTVDNALHHEDIVEKERLAEELKLGREIQQNLLPKRIPTVQGLKLEGLMLPAKEIGGDYYDFITTIQQQREGEGRLGVVIGDVSGKGVAAGLIMATAKATLKGLSQQELTPKQILSQANTVLFEYTGGQKFMTMLYFQYREKDKTLKYSSAGHEHILIYRNQAQIVEAVQSGGFMLGMIPNTETFLEEKELMLIPGDKILLYTDGVTEAENASGDRFGLPRLKEAFQKHGLKPASEFIQAIKDEVYAFIGPHPQYDDITLVVMEAT